MPSRTYSPLRRDVNANFAVHIEYIRLSYFSTSVAFYSIRSQLEFSICKVSNFLSRLPADKMMTLIAPGDHRRIMRARNCNGAATIFAEYRDTELWNWRDCDASAECGNTRFCFYQRQSRRSPVDPLESSYRRDTNDVGNTPGRRQYLTLDLAFSRSSRVSRALAYDGCRPVGI